MANETGKQTKAKAKPKGKTAKQAARAKAPETSITPIIWIEEVEGDATVKGEHMGKTSERHIGRVSRAAVQRAARDTLRRIGL